MLFNIVFCGYGKSGKDTAADYIVSKYDYSKTSFANPVREFAEVINAYFPTLGCTYNEIVSRVGYEEAKENQCVRDYLVSIGEGGRTIISPTVWIDPVSKTISNGRYAISDGRYSNETAMVKESFNIPGLVIRIKRKGYKAKHETEAKSIKKIIPDYVVRNDGTVEEFYTGLDVAIMKHRENLLHVSNTKNSPHEKRSLKVYVAGSFIKKSEVNRIQNLVRDMGHTITHDWTMVEEEENRVNSAVNDVNGVLNADVVVAVLSEEKYPYQGTYTEMGIAIGASKKIIILDLGIIEDDSKSYRRNVFYWHPSIERIYSEDDLKF